MGKRRKIILITLALIAGVSFAYFLARPAEPQLKGKPASFWINGLGNGTMGSYEVYTNWQAIGPEGIPFLVKALEMKGGRFQRIYLATWPKLPVKLKEHLSSPVNPVAVRLTAASQLGAFKTTATSAIPALVLALKTDEEFMVRENAIAALPRIGKDDSQALRAVIEALSDSNPRVRAQAARFLPQFENKTKLGVPELLKCLQDPDFLIRGLAADALKQIDTNAAASAGLK